MTSYAQQERSALSDTFLRVGPDAPTLCSPWLTRDLAAHLVIRDSRPDLAAGLVVPALRGRLDSAMQEYASSDWPALVQRVRSGPPAWSPTRIGPLDEVVNGSELFIHHEDVLRGTPDAEPRRLDVGLERFLWDSLKRGSRLFFRSVPTGVVLVAEGYGRHVAKKPTDNGTVVLRGRPGELVLYASGRARAARVEVEGSPDAVAELEAAQLGLG